MANPNPYHRHYEMGDDRMDEIEENEDYQEYNNYDYNQGYQDSDEDAEEEIDSFDEVMPEDIYFLDQNGVRHQANFRDNNQSSLEKSVMQFIRHTDASEHVFEQSSTLRLVKALHEKKLEHVILAIEEGACINFKVCLMLLFF